MTNPVKPFARRLRRGQFLHFTHPRQLCLRAERGSLWITVDGEPDDIELDAGHSRVFDGRSMVLVGSLGGDAVLSAVPLQRKPPSAPPSTASPAASLTALLAALRAAARTAVRAQ